MIDTNKPQHVALAEALAPLLEVVDDALAAEEVPLPKRPFRAVEDLLKYEMVELHGDVKINITPLSDYIAEPWLRVLYTGVEEWRSGTGTDTERRR